jgi:1A family penicillin-binding protein
MAKILKRIFWIDWKDILTGLIFVTIFLTFIPIFTYAYFARDLTSKESVMNKNDTGVTLLDRNGTPFFTFSQAKNKEIIPISEISPSIEKAVVASEDKDFYQHPGFSIKSILRSLAEDIKQGQLAYGGSTLTQQLVKNSLLTSQKNFLRKYQEVVLAYELERRYSKSEILEMYLNSVYFGHGAFGVEEAAQTYFGKPAKELDLAESSFLVALLPAPSRLSPFNGGQEEAKLRQKIVLQKMADQGYITQEQRQQAEKEQLNFQSPEQPMNSEAIHFAMMVKDQLVQKYGEEKISRSGFKVKTSIDLKMQKTTQEAVAAQVQNLKVNNVSNGAAMVLDPKTGEILALAGSRDWYYPGWGQVNVALQPRQPGSSFKPIYYSAALEKGIITPATLLQDKPTDFGGGYRPRNYDGKFRGPVTVRRALANSLNVPSVQVMSMLGVPNALDQAHSFGITTLENSSQYGLSLALGAGEVRLVDMAEAYAVFANGGLKNTPTTVLEIEDKSGKPVYQYQPENQPVLDSGTAFLISSILSDNKTRSEEFGNLLNISRTAAVKTGTTENYRDAWTLGYTPQLVVGAWVGNNDGTPMDNIAGSLGAAPIWKNLMEAFLKNQPVENFVLPSGVIKMSACRNGISLNTPIASGSAATEYFLPGTAPNNFCPASPSVTPTISPSVSPTISSSTVNLSPSSTATPLPTQTQITPTPLPTFTTTPTRSGPTPIPSVPTLTIQTPATVITITPPPPFPTTFSMTAPDQTVTQQSLNPKLKFPFLTFPIGRF